MKRLQLFELEDFSWFPAILRDSMTRYVMILHDVMGTTEKLHPIIEEIIEKSHATIIQDSCSGAGGPMLEVFAKLKKNRGDSTVELELSDLYPNAKVVSDLKINPIPGVSYQDQGVDVLEQEFAKDSIQTMICSFHHLPVHKARKVLSRAVEEQRAICIFEITDNSYPVLLWWLAFLPFWLMTYVLTLKIRPLRFSQIFFTYCIQILPICVAWDGAVSNGRTYTEGDLKELTADLQQNYHWEIRRIKNRTPSKMLCLIGLPA
jgi:hypothetical protein